MNRNEAKRRVSELCHEIQRHEYLYYVKDSPEISDPSYDQLFRELKALEERFPELVVPDSPTQRVGGEPVSAFAAVEHAAPMLSLDSDAAPEAVRRFDDRIRKAVGESSPIEYVLEPKLDGASVELAYDDGLLVNAATRGDGRRGEGVLENVKTIPSVPLRLRTEARSVPRFLSLRGEVIMRLEAFQHLNEKLMEQGREPFASPRNAAAGALRQLDPRTTASRPLDIYVYDILAGEGLDITTHWESHEALRAWGFRVNDLARLVRSVGEIEAFHAELEEQRHNMDYEMDGVVIKLNDLAAREKLGATSHHPRWAFAFKFPARREVTRVVKILVSVGRTGVVTPVAMLRPVELGGVTVSRATLHNREEVARKDIREGDRVRVQRAGDVIPQVIERLNERGKARSEPFQMPEKCPSCATPLLERGPFTYCPNGFDCPAQLAGRLTHLGSRNALDIEGLGEETAKLLVEKGLVNRFSDLFKVEAEQLTELEGFGEKSAANLVEGIRRASRVELARLLYGLGIPEVGVTVARDLARRFGSLEALREAGEEVLQTVDGVGPKMAEQIAGYFGDPRSVQLLDEQVGKLDILEAEPEGAAAGLAGLKFVLSGRLERLSRSEAKRLLESLGARVTSAVSAKTDYMVAGRSPGSKVQKAQELSVEILDEERFEELLTAKGVELPG